MLSISKKLLLIGLSAVVPAIAQATFIKNDVWPGGKTGSSQFDRNEYTTDFSRVIDFSDLFDDSQKGTSQDTKQSWQAIGSTKEISRLLRSKKKFAFNYGGAERNDFFNGKAKRGKRKGNKSKHERSISVPEPGTMALLALGLAGLGLSRRGEQQRSK